MTELIHPKDDKELREEIEQAIDNSLVILTAILIKLGVSNVDDFARADESTQEAIYSLRQNTINQILSKLDQYVKLADDQSIPENPIIPEDGYMLAWQVAEDFREKIKAGFRKVQLREEKDATE